jgi:dihydropteroate synthase
MGGVLEKILKLGVKVSVDTHKLGIARLALGYGASIVNDVCVFEHLDGAI